VATVPPPPGGIFPGVKHDLHRPDDADLRRVAAFGEIATRRPLECRLANNCGPLANPKDSPAEAGLLTCLRGSNACALSSGSGATAPRSDRPIRLYEPTFEMKVD